MKVARLLVFLLSAAAVSLHGTEFRFSRLAMNEGLSANSTGCIFTDNYRFTWIATINGLDKFDGETFKVYSHHRNDSTSLPGDNIFSVTGESNGDIWVGTNNGIAIFNPWKEQAVTPVIRQPENMQLQLPAHVFIDLDGTVWAWGTDGIWKYDRSSGILLPEIICTRNGGATEGCSGMYEDHLHRLWIFSYDGLYCYDRQTKKITQHYHCSAGNAEKILVTSMLEDHSGNLWIGTWGNGFGKFSPGTDTVSYYRWVSNPENPSANNVVFSIAENGTELWLATNHGLAHLDEKMPPDSDHVSFLCYDPSKPESIPSDQVNFVTCNNQQQVWAATSEGIAVLLPERQLFQPFMPAYTGQTTRIVNDTNGRLFFCTWYGNGLQLADSTGTILRTWKHIPAGYPDIDCGQVSDVLRAHDGSLWVATFAGLCHGDKDGEHFTQLLPVKGDSNSICDRRITCVAEDERGMIWCGSYGSGVSRYDPLSHQWKNFTKGAGLCDNLVWDISCDGKGTTWFATNSGISRYNSASKKMDCWKYIASGNDTFAVSICTTIFRDSRGTTWFGSESGLFYCDRNDHFGCYTKDDGLPSTTITGIREDDRHNIWVTTPNGLSCFHPSSGTFSNYSVASGLPTSMLNGDLGATENGKLIIGLGNSAVIFSPREAGKEALPAHALLTAVYVSGKKITFGDGPDFATGQEFTWDKNVFAFDFVAPGFHDGPGISYSYMLSGADKDWNYPGTRHAASYGGLPPGKYTFYYRVSGGNGKWSKPGSFSFVILPPFWKTWWFIGSVTIVILLLVIFIVRREATRKMREQIMQLEKKRAVEMERNRISRDMHDDLGSGLTKIAILSEVAKQQITNENTRNNIDNISESARNLVDNLNEIVWALNPGNDNLQNLAAYIREYAGRYLEPFDIRFTSDIPDQLPALHLSEEKRRFLFLVVKETLHNTVKHAAAGNVRIVFEHTGKQLRITVEDDGKGFEITTARPLGNGLKNMKKRMESIGATLEIISSPGKGTVVQIDVSAG